GSDNNSAFANDATSPPGLTRGSILFVEDFLQRRWIAGSQARSRASSDVLCPAMPIQRRVKDRGLSLRAAGIGAIAEGSPPAPFVERPRTSPSHGESRGSSPLGSANSFNMLAQHEPSDANTYGKYTA